MTTEADTVTGRLEIFLNGQWGTICSVGFTKGAALSACRQLGHKDQSTFGTVEALGIPVAPSSTHVLLSNVNCNYDLLSNEGHILRCDFSQSIAKDCSHEMDVAVQCTGSLYDEPYNTQVRLRGDAYPSSGTLQVYLKNRWGTVCYSGFTHSAANTACRQLGYTNSPKYESMMDLLDVAWLDDFNCHESHDCLRQCFNNPSSRITCNGYEVVHLNCTFSLPEKSSQTAGTESLCSGEGGLSAGAIVGVVFAVLIAVLICICVIICIWYRVKHNRYEECI